MVWNTVHLTFFLKKQENDKKKKTACKTENAMDGINENIEKENEISKEQFLSAFDLKRVSEGSEPVTEPDTQENVSFKEILNVHSEINAKHDLKHNSTVKENEPSAINRLSLKRKADPASTKRSQLDVEKKKIKQQINEIKTNGTVLKMSNDSDIVKEHTETVTVKPKKNKQNVISDSDNKHNSSVLLHNTKDKKQFTAIDKEADQNSTDELELPKPCHKTNNTNEENQNPTGSNPADSQEKVIKSKINNNQHCIVKENNQSGSDCFQPNQNGSSEENKSTSKISGTQNTYTDRDFLCDKKSESVLDFESGSCNANVKVRTDILSPSKHTDCSTSENISKSLIWIS